MHEIINLIMLLGVGLASRVNETHKQNKVNHTRDIETNMTNTRPKLYIHNPDD